MDKILIKYTKTDRMKFISHLELIRVIERALRRAEVPLKFSQGYNPHPKIAFAAPLSVGVSSEGEYMNIEVDSKIDLDSFKENINNQLPEGINFTSVKIVDDKAESLMSVVSYSSYLVKFKVTTPCTEEELNKHITDFLNKEEIIYEKKSNKTGKIKNINIREMIKDLILLSIHENEIYLKMIVATGSRGNLKPEVVLEKFIESENMNLDLSMARYHRLELYGDKNNNMTPIEDIY